MQYCSFQIKCISQSAVPSWPINEMRSFSSYSTIFFFFNIPIFFFSFFSAHLSCDLVPYNTIHECFRGAIFYSLFSFNVHRFFFKFPVFYLRNFTLVSSLTSNFSWYTLNDISWLSSFSLNSLIFFFIQIIRLYSNIFS